MVIIIVGKWLREFAWIVIILKMLCKECKIKVIKSSELCSGCYSKYYRNNNPNYEKQYYLKNKDKIKKRLYYWKKVNKEKVKIYIKKSYQNNKDKICDYIKNYKKENPERNRAYAYAYNHKQRKDKCLLCDLKEKLEFHHIDYKSRIGVTLCRKHHIEQTQLLNKYPM